MTATLSAIEENKTNHCAIGIYLLCDITFQNFILQLFAQGRQKMRMCRKFIWGQKRVKLIMRKILKAVMIDKFHKCIVKGEL